MVVVIFLFAIFFEEAEETQFRLFKYISRSYLFALNESLNILLLNFRKSMFFFLYSCQEMKLGAKT